MAQFAGPNAEINLIVGGLGNMSGSASDNGGGATKSAWDTHNPFDFITSNGGPIATATGCTVTEGDDYGRFPVLRITKASTFTGVVVGTIVFIDFDAIYDDGWYEILAVNDNWLDVDIEWDVFDTNCDVKVGGAIDTLQNMFDSAVLTESEVGTSPRNIFVNGHKDTGPGNITITSPIDVDAFDAAALGPIYVKGYNATLTAKAKVTILCSADVTQAINIDGVVYYVWEDIIINAGGKDASKAEFCVKTTGISRNLIFNRCELLGAELDGIRFGGGSADCVLIGCDIHDNGSYGIDNSVNFNIYVNCTVHDNDKVGIELTKAANCLIGNLIYNNGKFTASPGLDIRSTATGTLLYGNVFYGNSGSGLVDGSVSTFMLNNTAVSNAVYGYDLDTNSNSSGFFGNNHAFGNTTAHYSGGDDSTFADFKQGNNISGDPLFTSVVDDSEDFTPLVGSALIDSGLDVLATGNLDIGALQKLTVVPDPKLVAWNNGSGRIIYKT